MTEAALFYESARIGFGGIFLDDIQRAIDAIRERPEIGATIAYGFRRVLLQRFPFSVVYWIEDGEVSDRGRRPSTSTPELLDQARMTANQSPQRTSESRGRTVRAWMCARAGAERASCLTAGLDR